MPLLCILCLICFHLGIFNITVFLRVIYQRKINQINTHLIKHMRVCTTTSGSVQKSARAKRDLMRGLQPDGILILHDQKWEDR